MKLYQNLKHRLFNVLLGEQIIHNLSVLVIELKGQGETKNDIYELFINFHRDIQTDKRTKNNEHLYDTLSDFMDGL